MADYMIRVVLHDATAAQYSTLHKRMQNGGARRSVTGRNGIIFDLPDGEYVLSSTLSVEQVRDAVADIAASAKPKPDPSVVVVDYGVIAWQLRPVPGQS